MTDLLLAVNGTLMRGLELNPNLLAVGAVFLHETETEPSYRLWSIADRHPAMLRVKTGGAAIAVEVWSLSPEGLVAILRGEPSGLTIGKVRLADATEVLGVLAEPILCEGQREITCFGGWRQYSSAGSQSRKPATLPVEAAGLDLAITTVCSPAFRRSLLADVTCSHARTA